MKIARLKRNFAVLGAAFIVGSTAQHVLAAPANPQPLAEVPTARSDVDERIASSLEKMVPSDADAVRDAADLRAQKDMAKWAKWMLVATVFQAFVAVVSILLVLRSLRQSSAAIGQATTANQIAQGNHISERRPWLEVSGGDISFELTEHGLRFDLEVVLKNVGSSPARNLWIDLAVKPEPKIYSSALSNVVRDRVRTEPVRGEGVIFPGSTHILSESVTLPMREITALPRKVGAVCEFTALIVGAVRYESVFEGDPPKQSGFSFRTLTHPQDGIVVNLDTPIARVDAIELIPTERGWYAD